MNIALKASCVVDQCIQDHTYVLKIIPRKRYSVPLHVPGHGMYMHTYNNYRNIHTLLVG